MEIAARRHTPFPSSSSSQVPLARFAIQLGLKPSDTIVLVAAIINVGHPYRGLGDFGCVCSFVGFTGDLSRCRSQLLLRYFV